MNTFNWIVTACVPKNYPVKIIGGTLYFSDAGSTYIPPGKVLNNGWGEIGPINLAEDTPQPLPEKIGITWFSYRENKFYECNAALPYDEILATFKKGWLSPITNKIGEFDKIIVGLAPGGDISVWASGDSIVKEMATLEATEVKLNWSEFTDNTKLSRSEYIEKILKDKLGTKEYILSQQTAIPIGKWASYRKIYKCNLQIAVLSDDVNVNLTMFNGEKLYYKPINNLVHFEKDELAVPSEIHLLWTNYADKKYELKLTFDEKAIFKVFNKMNKNNVAEKLRLVIEVNDSAHQVLVFLANDTNYIVIPPVRIKKYSER